jgi:hypothetical protein
MKDCKKRRAFLRVSFNKEPQLLLRNLSLFCEWNHRIIGIDDGVDQHRKPIQRVAFFCFELVPVIDTANTTDLVAKDPLGVIGGHPGT